jgi:hypothetical protein
VLGIYLKRFFPKLLHRLVLKAKYDNIPFFYWLSYIKSEYLVDNTT